MSDKEHKQDTDAAGAAAETEKVETAAAGEAESSVSEDTAEGKEKEFEFAEEPTFTIDYKGDCAYEVKVSIGPANMEKQSGELFDKLQTEAQVPGFRPGRAPRRLIEKRFGKAVRGDATEKLVGAAFAKLVKNENLKPIQWPDIEGLEDARNLKEDDPITCTFKFGVAPRCQLGPYRGIELERPVLKVLDTDIDDALKHARERFATYEDLESGKAEEGDQVIIDFQGLIEGEAFSGGTAENYPYILGSKRFFTEFEAALTGVEAGGEVRCEVAFPEDYRTKALAGKTAVFTINVKEIKRRQLPDLDDDFAQMMGSDTLAELREKTAGELRGAANARSDQLAEANAVNAVVEGSTFELPKSLVDSSAEEYYEQDMRRLLELRVPHSEIEVRKEELLQKARANAIRNIRAFVAINEIGRAEGIKVTEADFEQEAEAIQDRTGMELDVISRFLQEDDRKDEYENRIFRKKALALVMENASVVEKEVSSEELDEEGEEDDA